MAVYRVLMPIDRQPKRVLAQAEAVVALPAASESVEVTVLHVFESEDEAEGTPIRELTAGERAIEYLTEERPVASLNTEGRWGDASEEILDAADAFDVDAIVLGGRKRSPMGSLLFGSVTTDVLLHAARPVTITGDHLVEDREDSPLVREGQDDVYQPPRKDLSKETPENPPDFVEEER